jgi:hypothetical protein
MLEVTYRALVELSSEGQDWEGVPVHAEGFVAHCVVKAREKSKDAPEDKDMVLSQSLECIRHRFDDEGLSGFHLGRPYTEAVRALCRNKITDEVFVKRVAPLLEGRYAYRGLNMLNLRFVPMSLCGQDSDNYIGKAYAKFIGKVSAGVTRATIEARFGTLERYSLLLPASLAASVDGVVQLLDKRMREYDGPTIVHSAILEDSRVKVILECPLDMETLQGVLTDSEDTREFASSVVRLAC